MSEYEKTSKTHIVRGLRQIWLRSKERAQALKRSKYCCISCGVKQSKAKGKEQKIQVHHLEGIGNWDKVINVIRDEILPDPDKLEALCPECHHSAEFMKK